MSYNLIEQQIKNKAIKNCYIFIGEEEYLKQMALERLYKELCGGMPRELTFFEFDASKILEADDIIECCDAPSMMAGHKIVVVRNTKLFAQENEKQGESLKLIDYISEITEDLTLIFYNNKNTKCLKTSKLYKAIKSKYGLESLIDFSTPEIGELTRWVLNICKREKKVMSMSCINYLIEIKNNSMSDIMMELNKLFSYCIDKNEIVREDIDNLCSKSEEYQIFALTDQLCQRNSAKALDILKNMQEKKVAAPYIISMLNWQFKTILGIKALTDEGLPKDKIAKELKIKDFLVTKYQRQIKAFSKEELVAALRDCQEADLNMKTGRMDAFLSLEYIIVKYAA